MTSRKTQEIEVLDVKCYSNFDFISLKKNGGLISKTLTAYLLTGRKKVEFLKTEENRARIYREFLLSQNGGNILV